MKHTINPAKAATLAAIVCIVLIGIAGGLAYSIGQSRQKAKDSMILEADRAAIRDAISTIYENPPLSSGTIVEMEDLRIENQRLQVRYDARNKQCWADEARLAILRRYEDCEGNRCLTVVEVHQP